MKYLLTILAAALLAGCCSTPTFTDKTTEVVNENAAAWDRIHTLVTLLPGDDTEYDGKTLAVWRIYVVAAETNAILLQHKAAGTKITYADAKAQAEQVVLP